MGAPVALPTAMVVGDAALPARAPAAIEASALGAPPSVFAERFAAARRDPAFSPAIATQVAAPRIGMHQIVPACMLVFGLAMMGSVGRGPGAGMGTLFLVGWCGLVGWFLVRAVRPLLAPSLARLGIVRSCDSHVRVLRDDDGARSQIEHRVTLELEDGRRVALQGEAAVIATLVEGDLGVAYTRADHLVGFRRLIG